MPPTLLQMAFDLSQYDVSVTCEQVRAPMCTAETISTLQDSGSIATIDNIGIEMSWARWIHFNLTKALKTSPDKVAIIEEIGEARCVTYGELMNGVYKVANFLKHHGIESDQCVGIVMDNSVEAAIYQLGLFLIGAVPVLFNPAHIAADRLSSTECHAVVVDSSHYGHVLRMFDHFENLQHIFVLSEELSTLYVPRNAWVYDGYGYLDFPNTFEDPIVNRGDQVVAFSTSGTEKGQAKVVVHSVGSAQLIINYYFVELISRLKEKIPDYDEATATHLITNGLYSIESWSYLLWSLLRGETAVMAEASSDVWRVSILDRVAQLIEQYKISLLLAHSQFLKCLVKYRVQDLFNISSLKIIAHSGSVLPGNIASEIRDSLDVSIIQVYSATEFGVIALDEVLTPTLPVPHCGEPFGHVDIKIADIEDDTETTAGVWGRIMVRTPTMFSRYLCTERKETKFVKNGWFKTDDYGCLDESARLFVAGPLESLMRTQDLVQCSALMECALLNEEAIDDIVIANFDGQITAGIVLKECFEAPSLTQLQTTLNECNLPAKLDKIILVDVIPRSETGKLIRNDVHFLLNNNDEGLLDGQD